MKIVTDKRRMIAVLVNVVIQNGVTVTAHKGQLVKQPA